MAYDRDDTRHRSRGEQDRWQGDRPQGRGRDDRGFFERAGEEIASWFGDDDRSERGRERSRDDRDRDDDRGSFRGSAREHSPRGNWSGPSEGHRDDEFGRSDRHSRQQQRLQQQQFGSQNPMREQGRYRGETPRSEHDRGPDDRNYRPMTGDYGRSARFSDGYREDNDGDHRSRFGGSQRPDSKWEQDNYRRRGFAGSRESSHHHDPHYHEWRERQLNELDRDYHEYHRERQSSFENDFGSWRERRQQKRQTLGQVREHMEVVGNDGEHVGTVDRTDGDRIILTRSDPQAGGAHHSISCNDVDRIESNRILLDCSADEARKRWRNEERSRALFERQDQGEGGPHMLDRSFSGTYDRD